MDEHQRPRDYLFDLDPPERPWRRLVGTLLWLAVAVLLAIPLRLLLHDDGAASQAASVPVASGLTEMAEMCSRFALPALLEQFAGLAYPIWSNVCNLVGR